MKPHPVTAKGVSTSGRIKNARLSLLPRRRRLDYATRLRVRRGFVSLKDVGATWEDLA